MNATALLGLNCQPAPNVPRCAAAAILVRRRFSPRAMIAAQTLARAAAAPRLRIVLLALLLALLASTQFLFQPFVWRNWPLDEVLLGWFDVAGWFALVALTISAAVLGALNLIDRLPRAHRAWRALLFATFVIARAGSVS